MVKLLSLFSGIGAFEKALVNMGVPFELVAFCEIDSYAAAAYQNIHGVPGNLNLGDIAKVDENALPKDVDMVTYGFPCQDISVCGSQNGLFNADGSRTRSGLFFDAVRIINATRPRVAVAENVKNLTSKRFSEQFKAMLEALCLAGYNNYVKVLNAKDFGIPQNRDRVFIVSIRKDIDCGGFKFPCGSVLQTTLKDLMERDVEERWYIDKPILSTTSTPPRNGVVKVGNIYPSGGENGNIYLDTGIAPTLKAGTGISGNGIGSCNAPKVFLTDSNRIRKLTPKECCRLMGFTDKDYAAAKKGASDTQIYKQAGNSVAVPVLQALFSEIFRCNAIPLCERGV